jgi:hypothetical protein
MRSRQNVRLRGDGEVKDRAVGHIGVGPQSSAETSTKSGLACSVLTTTSRTPWLAPHIASIALRAIGVISARSPDRARDCGLQREELVHDYPTRRENSGSQIVLEEKHTRQLSMGDKRNAKYRFCHKARAAVTESASDA